MLNYVKAKILNESGSLSLKIEWGEGTSVVYHDVSRDRELLETFVSKINSGRVSHLHIEDMIEDFLP